jgi:hypothetical protein
VVLQHDGADNQRIFMLTREFAHAGHVTRVTITRSAVGWDLREERDDRIVRRMNYTDWHRVERAIQVIELAGQRNEDAPS